MMNKIVIITLLLSEIIFCQPTYEFEIISIPEMDTPLRMKGDGSAIVGTNYGGQAVYWSDSTGIQILGVGELWGISENGRIFAELANEDGNWEAALIENGETTFVGNIEGGNTCDAFYSHGLNMSRDGTTGVGMGWINCSTSAFYWTDENGIVELGQYQGNSTKAQAVSGDGQVIGGWAQTNSRNSVLWDREGNITFLGSLQQGNDYGEVNAISNDGLKAVGFSAGNAGNNVEGYIWTAESGMFGLGVPTNSASNNTSLAFAISENDVVVGQYLNESPVFYKACIYTSETGEFVNLRQYLLDLGMAEISGWDLTRALCVSNDGNTLAGYGKDPSGNWTGWVIQIIEGEGPEEILLVPSQYATIQDAIDASENRDTILVAPGTYQENINYSGKNIVIGSYAMIYGSSETFISQSIIDGGGNNSVVTMNSGEDSSAVLYGFTIQNGNAEFGGGIMIESSEPTFEYLLIKNNVADYGGGVYARYEGEPMFNHVTVMENSSGQGGGMRFRDDANPTISNCTIKWNTASGKGGGIYCNNSDPEFFYTLITGNYAVDGGDAVYLKINCNPLFTNTTIEFNGSSESNSSSGIYCITNSHPQFISSIIWGNVGSQIEFSSASNPNFITISYCDLENGQEGIVTNNNGSISWLQGNINQDPLFCYSWEWDFTLAEDSPCVGTGIAGNNMGAFDVGCGPMMSINENLPTQFSLKQNYPNPFNPTTTIEYSLARDTFVDLAIYDVAGRKVKTLVNKNQSQGTHYSEWKGMNETENRVPSGIYFIKIRTGDFSQSRKMILLK